MNKLTDTTPCVAFARAPSTWSEAGWASRDQGTCEHTDQQASGPQIDSPAGCLCFPANRPDVLLHERRLQTKTRAKEDKWFHCDRQTCKTSAHAIIERALYICDHASAASCARLRNRAAIFTHVTTRANVTSHPHTSTSLQVRGFFFGALRWM